MGRVKGSLYWQQAPMGVFPNGSIQNDLLRFASYCEERGDCLVWTGAVAAFGRAHGIGTFYVPNAAHSPVAPHRYWYRLTHGVPPPRLSHRCRTELCVIHWEPWISPPKPEPKPKPRYQAPCGMAHYRARYTDDQAREIRRLREEGWSYRQLAAKFDCNFSLLSCVINRSTWKHI